MIDYANTIPGDILKISEKGAGAPGYAEKGDFVRVVTVCKNGVKVEDKRGETAEFFFTCGAARLEPTEWRNDFPPAPTPPPETWGGTPGTSPWHNAH